MHTFIKKNAFILTVDEGEMGLKASWAGLNRKAELFIDYLAFK